MLEGKALVVAIMMLTAAPIAATDQGQAFIGYVTYEIGEVFNDEEEETKVVDKVIDEADIKDKELLLGTWQGLYLFEHRLESHTRTLIHHYIGD